MFTLRRALAAVPAASLGLLALTATGTPAHAVDPTAPAALAGDLRLAAVYADGSPDWIEVANVSGHDVTLTGWDLTDDDPVDDSHPIPDGTALSAGQTLTVQVGTGADPDFGLGKSGDAATLRLSGTAVDSVTWTAKSTATGFARCAYDAAGDTTWTPAAVTQDGTFTCPDAATVAAALTAAVRINEADADGTDTDPDWVELTDTGTVTADVSGWHLTDSKGIAGGDDVVLPAGSTIAPQGFLTTHVDTGATGAFGLGADGKADDATVLLPDAATQVDTVDWAPSGAASGLSWVTGKTIGRCPDGTGPFGLTTGATENAANQCPDTSGGGTGQPGDIRLNEVSNDTDTIELVNTGTAPVDITGWTQVDDDPTHAPKPIPGAGVIEPGAVFSFASVYGLGASDAVTIFDAAGAQVLTYRLPASATPSYARCPDGLGSYQLVPSTQATFGSPNDAGCPAASTVTGFETSSLVLNEVSMNSGGGHGDFIEVKNVGATAVDLTGMGLSDDKHPLDASPDWQPFPAGTMLAPGERAGFETTFGLGGDQGDEANLWLGDKTTLVDGVTWIKGGTGDGTAGHPLPWPATTSIGRCPDDATTVGAWQESNTVTFGAVNDCSAYDGGTSVYDPTTDGAQPWPGGQAIHTSDAADMFYLPASDDGIEETYGDASGAVFDPTDPNTLWVAKNKRGTLFKLRKQADGSWAPAAGWEHGKDVRFVGGTGHPDTEGLTVGPDGDVYMTSERDNANDSVNQNMVLQFDQDASTSELTATRQWDLTSALPDVPANLGLEGVTWVPDSYLVAGGLREAGTGAAYDPASYPLHGSGLFLVAFEGDGNLYAFALNSDGSYAKVATIASGFPAVMDVQYDAERGSVWATCDDTCGDRYAELRPAGGTLARVGLFKAPADMPVLNNEGMAIAPQSTCVGGTKEVVWTDDGNTDHHSLRSGTIACTPPTTGDGGGDGGHAGTPAPPVTTPVTTPVVVHHVTGKSRVGKKLTVTVTAPSGAHVSYQWFAGKKRIKHATHHRLRLTKKLRHKRVKVRVTIMVPGQPPVVRIVKLHARVR